MKKMKCHCGAFEAEINVNKIDKVLRCNCSICKRKGTIMSIVRNEDFKIIKGTTEKAEFLSRANIRCTPYSSRDS